MHQPAGLVGPSHSGVVSGLTSEIRVQIRIAAVTDWPQDADTLDTWFSSWLWAYETMDAETREKFYPTSVLVTAPDIIFFWVARMIIAGLEFKPGKIGQDRRQIPFRDVFFTGMIRDKQGRKMCKSLGNSPDPLELIAEIWRRWFALRFNADCAERRRTFASKKSRSKKAAISPPSFGTRRGFVRCTDRRDRAPRSSKNRFRSTRSKCWRASMKRSRRSSKRIAISF